MATIAKDQPVVTLVNVFTVEPERQRELVDLLVSATEQVMCRLPGYVSANLTGSRCTSAATTWNLD